MTAAIDRSWSGCLEHAVHEIKRTTTRLMSRRRMVAASAATVAAAGVGAVPARCMGKIYPGVRVNGIDVAGLTPDDARRVLRQEMASFEEHAITFVFGDASWDASLSDLGMSIDYDSILSSAMDAVRGDGFTARLGAVVGEGEERKVPLYLHRDASRLDAFLAGVASDIAIEPRNARLYTSGSTVKMLEHRDGRALDVDRAREDALRLARGGRTGTVELQVRTIQPEVTTATLEGDLANAVRLVSEPVVLTHDNAEFIIDTEELSTALVIGADSAVTLDVSAMASRIDQIAAAVHVAPRNVMLGWDGGLYVVEPDQDGKELDRDALATIIHELAGSDDRIGTLPVVTKKAEARADNMESLGIENHLAAGSSSFAGSSYERAANVAVSARNVSYKLVAPGEEFSFNELLGPISLDMGYISGSIIQGDFAETDIGGGVCQVSTTVFRAALNAGFRFSEWNPHSWRLAFYEADGSSPGLDAAIYQPNNEWEYELDLRFVNPLDSWILMQVIVDGEWVTAHFYGRDPGWSVEVFPAVISEPKPIPAPVEKVNLNLAPGERRQVGLPAPGYTVRVRRVVTGQDGAVISDGEFVSDYVSQPEAWEVGPS